MVVHERLAWLTRLIGTSLSSPIQEGGDCISRRDEGQDNVGLAVGRDDHGANSRCRHEHHVEADVVEGEDPTPVGIVNKGLHQRVDTDLDALGGDSEQERGDQKGRLGVQPTGKGLRDSCGRQQSDGPQLRGQPLRRQGGDDRGRQETESGDQHRDGETGQPRACLGGVMEVVAVEQDRCHRRQSVEEAVGRDGEQGRAGGRPLAQVP